MTSPVISVIVPVYNVEPFLNRCIKSLVVQTFKDFELILVDDGSKDNCPELCDKWAEKDKRIIVIHQENQGLSSARNSGIRKSSGQYLTFIDSDDWITENMLEMLINLIKKYNADMSVCSYIRTNSENITLPSEKISETAYSRDEFMDIILKIKNNRTIHYACGKLYKRHIIDDNHYPVGMLNEDVEGMFKAVIRCNKIVETNIIGYYYYENPNSITRQKFGENFLCLNEVWRRVLDISLKEAPQYAEKVKFNLKRMDFTILTDMLLYGDRDADLKYKTEIISVRKRLRQNINDLLKGPMVFKRKILAFLVCYFYTPIRAVLRITHT